MVLNAELVDIEKWRQGNKLSLNVIKTQAMIVGSMQNVNKMAVQLTLLPVFHVGGTDFDLRNKVNYLGLYIDNSLTLKCQIENIKGKFSCGIGLLNIVKLCINGNLEVLEPHLNYCWYCENRVSPKATKQGCSNRYGLFL